MLTATPGRCARLNISSTVVRLALVHVASESGRTECPGHHPGCNAIVISDAIRPNGRVDVLVVRDDPAACQDAIEAALTGRIRSILLWNTPHDLTRACEAIDAGLAVIPWKVIDLAALAPKLTVRQRETLRLLARGSSSQAIAGALHQSESTSKRDIAELLQLFDVPNRTALVRSAATLGFVPGPGPTLAEARGSAPTCSRSVPAGEVDPR